MKEHTLKILEVFDVTHDVRGFHLEKPEGYTFRPGQATNVSVNKEGLKEKRRPFTFTNLPDDDVLEFIIKIYPSHNGVTKEVGELKKGDELIITKPWGSIEYKGEGVFLAGGAGITPFISIFRNLKKKEKLDGNMLIFANNTSKDIILKDEFEEILGKEKFINILAEEESEKYHHGLISKEFLKEQVSDFDRMFYLCGPPPMMKAVEKHLDSLEVDKKSIVKEKF